MINYIPVDPILPPIVINTTINSTYGFINKDGPREYAYNFTQGGFHIYKQTNQTNQTVA